MFFIQSDLLALRQKLSLELTFSDRRPAGLCCLTWRLLSSASFRHTRVSHKSNKHECPTRVLRKRVPQECLTRVCHKRVPQVSHKSVPRECPTRVFYKSAPGDVGPNPHAAHARLEGKHFGDAKTLVPPHRNSLQRLCERTLPSRRSLPLASRRV